MLYNKDYQAFAELDMSKPIWFCDVDGVLNALPFERNWIGGSSSSGMYDPELWNPDNWETVRLKPNTGPHFSLTDVTVSFNQWADSEYHRERKEENLRTLQLRYSPTLIKRIRRLIKDETINFVWLTAWQSEASRILNALFGFPEIPFLAFNKYSTRGPDLMKLEALLDFFDEHEEDAPWIWVDDTATRSSMDSWGRKRLNELIHAQSRLVVQTDSKWGISRQQIHRIEKFAQSF